MRKKVFKSRKRYIMVNGIKANSSHEVESAVKEVFGRLFGLEGLSLSGLRTVHLGKLPVFSCNHDWTPKVILALSLVRQIEGKKTVLKTVKISGTIKSLLKNR
ncbi:MAG: Rpp14/Pop5 family protein [Candidatus Caldarchaeum sp.]|nr:Rpp14/Pop5 family protein [Candidatus Caldarchaeum sp.]MCS7133421.1 Rpp14/Pop5 family protein [Candidatus Caldarchaeum sp.]MCX8201016.1 Rpp14/Pop5 family protein [Candidatus Caldarchaeum sp.]MDW8062776.1 Rpp14/Pop5 family protein [Candidatus Caldarchaeum sp.]MDW8435805.1 Rpp14/Pop5 family protein [Candidatus Caldarchaeum sp.]